MTIYMHQGDVPATLSISKDIALDTETMGLNPHRDRLCLVQLSTGNGDAHLIQFKEGEYQAPNLRKILSDPKIGKLYHFARFDLAILRKYLGVVAAPVYCTKTASRLCRTFTDKHSLKDLCREILGVEINKNQQTSDWGAVDLNEDQKAYAANDVLYLHQLRNRLDDMLAREGRTELAKACFDFLPTRAELDIIGWPDIDIFSH